MRIDNYENKLKRNGAKTQSGVNKKFKPDRGKGTFANESQGPSNAFWMLADGYQGLSNVFWVSADRYQVSSNVSQTTAGQSQTLSNEFWIFADQFWVPSNVFRVRADQFQTLSNVFWVPANVFQALSNEYFVLFYNGLRSFLAIIVNRFYSCASGFRARLRSLGNWFSLGRTKCFVIGFQPGMFFLSINVKNSY